MRLLLDEMLDPEIAVQLRARGWDVTAVAGDRMHEGSTDEALLRACVETKRVIVTDNVDDFLRLHARLVSEGEEHCGAVLASPSSFPRGKRFIGLWVTALEALLESGVTEAQMRDSCLWLPRP